MLIATCRHASASARVVVSPAIVVSIVVLLVGMSLTPFMEVATSIVLAFRCGGTFLMNTGAPNSDATEPIVTAKA